MKIPQKYFVSGYGKKRSMLETRRFVQGVKTIIPVLAITGRKTGPVAVIMACQHGCELNGISAIERAFNSLEPENMSGMVVFLPVMNPVAVRIQRQDYPSEAGRYRQSGDDGANMNRTWLRNDTRDTYAGEITALVWETFLQHADVALDLHGWSGLSLCLAWSLPQNRQLLREFGLPWHMLAVNNNFMCENAAAKAGIPFITCELTPQDTICNKSVYYGEQGIYNLLMSSGILRGKPKLPAVQYEFEQNHVEHVIKTPVEGLVVSDFEKGQMIRKGGTVLRILALDSLKTAYEYKAPENSLIFNVGATMGNAGFQDSSIVYPGQTVGLLKEPALIINNKQEPIAKLKKRS